MKDHTYTSFPISLDLFVEELAEVISGRFRKPDRSKSFPWIFNPEYQPQSRIEQFVWTEVIHKSNEEQALRQEYDSVFMGYTSLKARIDSPKKSKIVKSYTDFRSTETVATRSIAFQLLNDIFIRLIAYNLPDLRSELMFLYSKSTNGTFTKIPKQSESGCDYYQYYQDLTNYEFERECGVYENSLPSDIVSGLVTKACELDILENTFVSNREVLLQRTIESGNSGALTAKIVSEMLRNLAPESVPLERHTSECLVAMRNAISELWEADSPPTKECVFAWLTQEYPQLSQREVEAIDKVMRPSALKGKRTS